MHALKREPEDLTRVAIAMWLKLKRRLTLIPTSLLALSILAGCRTGSDFQDPAGPRYAAGAPVKCRAAASDTLRIVSFNIAFSREIDRALEVFASEPALHCADIILLQEMDATGTAKIASSLGMQFVYYPALFHRKAKKEFGNAVLARWPIVGDTKIRLPHGSRFAGTHRTATAATVRIRDTLVRVYSTHLGTPADISPAARRTQLRTIIADATPYRHVIIGGDMNSSVVGGVAAEAGYVWPTGSGPWTTSFGRWDHVYLRGLAIPDSGSTGTVRNARGSSDHLPIWVLAQLYGGNVRPFIYFQF